MPGGPGGGPGGGGRGPGGPGGGGRGPGGPGRMGGPMGHRPPPRRRSCCLGGCVMPVLGTILVVGGIVALFVSMMV